MGNVLDNVIKRAVTFILYHSIQPDHCWHF
ncbi:hypothetical protein NYA30BAC_02978 [Halomonas sp. NYA30]